MYEHMDKFTKGTTKKKLVIPTEVMERSGFQKGAPVDILTLTDAVVILKNGMTTMELLNAVDQMKDLSVALLTALAENCDPCGDCGGTEDGSCPYLDHLSGTEVPAEVLQEAGIPAGAKLCAWANPDSGIVNVAQAGYRYDLADVPVWELEILTCMGVCLEDLAELLMSEDQVHV